MKLPRKKKDGNKDMMTGALSEQAVIDLAYQKNDDTEGFIETLENVTRKSSDSEKAEIFFEIAGTLYYRSFYVLGLASLFHSLVYYTRIGDRKGEWACYGNIGEFYRKLGQYRKTIEYFEKALPLYREIGDKKGELTSYANIVIACHSVGQYRKVLEYQEKAVKIAKERGYKDIEAAFYDSTGKAYVQLGQYREAIEYFEKALPMFIEIDNKGMEAACYGNIGVAYLQAGQYREVLEYQEKALPLYREIDDKGGEAACYVNIGKAYVQLGQYREAIEYFEKALKIDKERGHKGGEAACYSNIGVAYRIVGHYREALEYQEKALTLYREIDDKGGEAVCYRNIGIACSSLGHYREAIEYLERALLLHKEIGTKEAEAVCYVNIGSEYLQPGQYREAIEYFEKALKIAKERGYKGIEAICYTNLALTYQENNPYRAYQYLAESINMSESMAAMLVEEEQKIGFQSTTASNYERMVPLCLKLQKEDSIREAFQYVERSKSRALVDLMAASTGVKPTVPMTKKLKSLIDRENEDIARLRQIQTQHLRGEKVIVEPGEVDRLRKELEDIYDEIGRYDKQYVSLRKPQPISLSEVQAKLGEGGLNVAMVEYFVTKEKTFIFVVNQKELHVKEVEVPREKLMQYTDNYQRKIIQYLDRGDIGDFLLQELSKYLIEPISGYLSNVNLLYFVPHDMLHYIPLHTLLLKGKPIIIHFPVVYTPSESLMEYFRTGKGRLENSAAFGVVLKEDEQLFGEEAEMVSRLLNCQHFPNATKRTVLSNLRDRDVLHFSCHGYFNNFEPLSSGIVFHGDEYKTKEGYTFDVLTAREIFNLKERMNADLVTVSACQTGLSDRRPGDELIGLTRSLLYAGAASIVVSLWSVAAHSTMQLMEEFYTELKEGKDKATALQQAMIKIMMKREYSHPYFWAPFILVGDWK